MSPAILVAFGTRPELIKLWPVIRQFTERGAGERLLLVCAGQHTDLLDGLIPEMQAYPVVTLPHCTTPDQDRMLQHMTAGIEQIIHRHPSLSLAIVQGDTNAALAAAVAANRCGLRVAHVEAGLRSHFPLDPFPEEINRITISALAHVHFAPTADALQHLRAEGTAERHIVQTGNTAIDALRLINAYPRSRTSHVCRRTIIVTLHRSTLLKRSAAQLADEMLALLAHIPDLDVSWVLHPNRIGRPDHWPQNDRFHVIEPMTLKQFAELMDRACVVITDSGGVQEEATASGIPLVVFRHHHERPASFGTGSAAILSMDPRAIAQFVRDHHRDEHRPSHVYGDGYAADRIVDRVFDETARPRYRTAIIGGGPAGTGPVLAAMKAGSYRRLLSHGLAIVERSPHLLCGSLSGYKVNSDTLANVFLECLEGETGHLLWSAELAARIAPIRERSGRSIPLPALDGFLKQLGHQLGRQVRANPNGKVVMGSSAIQLQRSRDGSWHIHHTGDADPIHAQRVVIATGADHMASHTLDGALTDGSTLQASSQRLLQGELDEALSQRITISTRIQIIGGSHSGFSAAWYLLDRFGDRITEPGAVRIISRARPKIFYPSVAEALSQGYTDHGSSDICPITGRLYRLAGLRMDGRALYLRMLGLERPAEHRVELIIHSGQDNSVDPAADIVIDATGYRFRCPSIVDEHGAEIKLLGAHTGHWVDHRCRLLNTLGEPVTGLFAIGLATGFLPSGSMGGEPSFTAQTNGLWYYQNDLGAAIINELLNEDPADLS